MVDPKQAFPDVHFGEPDDEDDAPLQEEDNNEDVEDEELEVTPPDVIAMLGFDPKEKG